MGTFVRFRDYAAPELVTVIEELDLPRPLTIVANPYGPGQMLIAGDPALVGIVVRADHAEVGPGTTWWSGPHRMPAMRDPETVALPGGLDRAGLGAVQTAVDRSLTRRRRGFRRCRACGELRPPEGRVEPDVCHACGPR